MKYRSLKGYKYELLEMVDVATGIQSDNPLFLDSADHAPVFAHMTTGGVLRIFAHYAWDGPSGPTFDTKTFMRGSLAHDCCYQLMREGKLDRSYRKRADELLREICLEDGMNRFRAWYAYKAVRLFGKKSSMPRKRPRGKVVEI